MSIEKLLGSMSPAYGAATGRGVFGDVQKELGPASGILFQIGKSKRDADDANAARKEFDAKYGFNSNNNFRKGGKVKKMAKGGSASKRADGCARKGKTKGKFC